MSVLIYLLAIISLVCLFIAQIRYIVAVVCPDLIEDMLRVSLIRCAGHVIRCFGTSAAADLLYLRSLSSNDAANPIT